MQDDRHPCYDVWFGGSDKREAELKILRFSLGALNRDRIKNETTQIKQSGDKVSNLETSLSFVSETFSASLWSLLVACRAPLVLSKKLDEISCHTD